MGLQNPFVRWWLTFTITFVAIATALLGGIGSFILANDVTFLSWGILAILLGSSIHLGRIAKQPVRLGHPKSYGVPQFCSNVCTTLGLLGTIIGLIVGLLSPFVNLDMGSKESMQEALKMMASGVGAALVTTMVGIVASMLLNLQMVIVKGSCREEFS